VQVDVADCLLRAGSRILIAGFSHRFEGGQVTALMGPSGAGKSTLLGAIAGISDVSAGTIAIHPPHARIALTTQASTLFMERTTLDNLALGAISRGLTMQAAREVARDLGGEVGLGEVLESRAHQLSGGERQRAMIARSIAAGAQVLLADEPTASLDLASRDIICSALRLAAVHGSVVIVATHDSHVADSADTVLSPWAES